MQYRPIRDWRAEYTDPRNGGHAAPFPVVVTRHEIDAVAGHYGLDRRVVDAMAHSCTCRRVAVVRMVAELPPQAAPVPPPAPPKRVSLMLICDCLAIVVLAAAVAYTLVR